MLNLNALYCTLNLTDLNIQLVVTEDNTKSRYAIYRRTFSHNNSVSAGVVVDPKIFSSIVSQELNLASRSIGRKILRVNVVLPSSAFVYETTNERSNVHIERGVVDKYQMEESFNKAMQQFVYEDYECVFFQTFGFMLDDEFIVGSPLGERCKDLLNVMNAYMLHTKEKSVLTKAIADAGAVLVNIIPSDVAKMMECLDIEMRREGVAIVTIDANITHIAVWKNERGLRTVSLDYGWMDIAKQIAEEVDVDQKQINNYLSLVNFDGNYNDLTVSMNLESFPWKSSNTKLSEVFRKFHQIYIELNNKIVKKIESIIDETNNKIKVLFFTPWNEAKGFKKYSEKNLSHAEWKLVNYKPTCIGLQSIAYAEAMGASQISATFNRERKEPIYACDAYIPDEVITQNMRSEKIIQINRLSVPVVHRFLNR